MNSRNDIKITCAILCYNYGRYLHQAIDSCLNQSLDTSLYEVLIIDDGSTDETPNICSSYGNKIRVSRTKNQGFAKSIERALVEANGDYVAYLDADDWWHKDKLAKVYQELTDNILVVAHNLSDVNENGVEMGRIGACGNTSSVCVHRLAGLTLMPTTTEIFCQPLLDIGKGKILNDVLGYYRIHEKAMTDRTPNGKHTAFFANTNYVLANNLYSLKKNLPFWLDNEKIMDRLAKKYFSEGVIKDFERATELSNASFGAWFRMVGWILSAKRRFGKRELRLTVRLLLQKTGLKNR
ncbi:glycosyltransferase family 2 protein [Parasediminibacterium paludis]|uniref:Glycosyltransferase family 2 protein n=1 Tax=Parasediminibacterium paludis TaxID=908966 RepID=A0ABV8Q0Y3_9BACT